MSSSTKRTADGRVKSRTSDQLVSKDSGDNDGHLLPPEAAAQKLKEAAIDMSLDNLEEQVADACDAWEMDSLFEDALEALAEESYAPCSTTDQGDVCTPEESNRLRRELRQLGPVAFCERTVDAGRYTARKLLSAFGIRPPAFLEGEPDESYHSLLSLAITRELSKRAKLSRYNTVDDAVALIARCSNIVLITGAGISTSLGIPDFRSQGTGLYSKLAHLGLSDPQEVFDINVFKEDPSIFYSVAKDIIPATDRYTPTHKFIAMLNRRGKLLTNYSQNIDNIEVKAGVPKDRLIQCHGSFGTASCVVCRYQVPGETIFPDIRAGHIPQCPRCAKTAADTTALTPTTSRTSAKRRRASDKKRRRQRSIDGFMDDDDDDEDDDGNGNSCSYDTPAAGVMKPDITFFGEDLPDEFSRRLTEHDRDRVDLVIVVGTSLKVTPVSEIVSWLPAHVPQIYVSRQPVTHINFDIDLLGDCDVVVAELCRRLGWPLDHDMVPRHQVVNVVPAPDHVSRHVFTATTGTGEEGGKDGITV